jgi:hypothetical protein
MPPTEELTPEERRKLAAKYGEGKWLALPDGWLRLLAGDGPRLFRSGTERHFVRQAVAGLYPRDRLRETPSGTGHYLDRYAG